jgi:hypothetical protein
MLILGTFAGKFHISYPLQVKMTYVYVHPQRHPLSHWSIFHHIWKLKTYDKFHFSSSKPPKINLKLIGDKKKIINCLNNEKETMNCLKMNKIWWHLYCIKDRHHASCIFSLHPCWTHLLEVSKVIHNTSIMINMFAKHKLNTPNRRKP